MINSWATYKNWISTVVMNDTQYYFRGQQNPSWKLQTSFHRYSEKTGITMLDYLNRIIPDVSFYVSAHQNETIDISNENQFGALLAKLQHHGFPTPLLDWTLSPYIAAYFAFKNIDPHNPDTQTVTIHMFDVSQWSTTFQQPLDFRGSVDFVSTYRPHAKGNPRMIQQMAVATATNVSDLSNYLYTRGTETKKTFLYQATLPITERKMIMKELNLMGINSMTMFPDFDGVCSSMKEFFFNDSEVKPLVPAPPPPPKAA